MPEPIYWASKKTEKQRRIPATRFNAATGQMEQVFDEETGEAIHEKIPQRGHVAGDYENPVPGRARWMHVLRHDGHTVRIPLTCAAADYDLSQLTAQERRAKARYYGWIPVGHCPLALIQAGELKRGQLVCKELRDSPPSDTCAHGSYGEKKHCRHYLAEEAARRTLQTKKQAAADKKMQPEADRLIAAQQEQTKEIVNGVAGVLAEAIRVGGGGGKQKP